VGPTASGKTALAIEMAQKFDGEIICADSRTVYKSMDIGTAKPTNVERELVPHHLLDVVEPDEPFTVADFKKLANESIDDICRRGKLPIMVGGSGLYIDAVLFDYGFASKGAKHDPTNPRHLDKSEPQIRHGMRDNTLLVGLNPDLEVIKQRITDRVDEMLSQGFEDEVGYLYSKYGDGTKALQAPGYRAFRDYIENKISLDEAKAQFIRNDYLLARRQRTWFKRNKSIHWLDNREEYVDILTTFLNKKQ
jgi:tRNA dimethylallyltransferase